MSIPRIILAIATLLTSLSMLGLAIYGLTIPHWGLFFISLILSAGFGVFSYADYKFFFQEKK